MKFLDTFFPSFLARNAIFLESSWEQTAYDDDDARWIDYVIAEKRSHRHCEIAIDNEAMRLILRDFSA